MPNDTYTLDYAENPGELGTEFNTGINLEIRLSETILAGMADKNYETTFTLGIDPAHGVTLEYGNSRWAQFSEDPFSRLPVAPLLGPRESPVAHRTTAEPPQDPTEASGNEAGQSEDEEDEEWLNEIAATLVPVRRPKLPDQDPLGKLP